MLCIGVSILWIVASITCPMASIAYLMACIAESSVPRLFCSSPHKLCNARSIYTVRICLHTRRRSQCLVVVSGAKGSQPDQLQASDFRSSEARHLFYSCIQQPFPSGAAVVGSVRACFAGGVVGVAGSAPR